MKKGFLNRSFGRGNPARLGGASDDWGEPGSTRRRRNDDDAASIPSAVPAHDAMRDDDHTELTGTTVSTEPPRSTTQKKEAPIPMEYESPKDFGSQLLDLAPAPNTVNVPKAALYSFYSPRRVIVGPEDYISWTDGGQPHCLKFTSIFVDPTTGECFPSGRYKCGEDYCIELDGVCWYTKKTLAEHGAAARAFDCITTRDARLRGGTAMPIGLDPPSIEPFRVPTGLPPYVLDKIRERQSKASKMT